MMGEKARKGSHLTEDERNRIAMLLNEGWSPYKIGKELGRAANTIRNEIKRGTTTIFFKYFEKTGYFPDTGQAVYEKNRRKCRAPRKIQTCSTFISYVEEQVLKHKRSFASVRAEVLAEGLFQKEGTCSVTMLYAYTERGLLKIKNIDLPEKVGRRCKKSGKVRIHKRLHGVSISERPEAINTREEFGHWEIDLVIGKKTSGDKVLLTLTERKTRKEIVRKIQNKTVKAVHRALKKLKKEIPYFNKVFKSITTDNGTEFSSLYKLGKRLGIDVYYAHPYSSWERGQNENGNKVIRRFIPKGQMVKNYTRGQIQEIENWMNSLYRKSLGWRTADECYNEEIKELLAGT